MNIRFLKIVSFTFVCLLLFIIGSNAQDTHKDKHIEVSLRMIGHQILLSSGDSTSRVLPIIEESGRYRIQFESDIEFNPEELVSIVDRVVQETNIAKNYIVEVEKCKTGEVVYSFEMDYIEKSDIIPCKTRNQPKSCYNLVFTLAETDEAEMVLPTESHDSITGPAFEMSKIVYLIIGVFLVLIMIVFFFVWRRKNKPKTDPNLIPIGGYHFDKRNTELLIEHQKIELTSKEADLLLLLYNAANTTVERDIILNMVWGDEGDYVGRTLDVFISKLRKKLEFDSKVKIVNIRGVGYKLVIDDK